MKALLRILLLATLAMAPVIVRAQQRPTQGPPGERRGMAMSVDEQVARMKERLKLTDEQATKVKALLERLQQERRDWMQQNAQASPEERRAQFQKWMEERNEGLKKILTPEQWKQFQEQMEQMRNRMRGDREQPHP